MSVFISRREYINTLARLITEKILSLTKSMTLSYTKRKIKNTKNTREYLPTHKKRLKKF